MVNEVLAVGGLGGRSVARGLLILGATGAELLEVRVVDFQPAESQSKWGHSIRNNQESRLTAEREKARFWAANL